MIFKSKMSFNNWNKVIKSFGIIYQKPFSEIIQISDFNRINEMIEGNNKFILKFSAKRDGCNTDIYK